MYSLLCVGGCVHLLLLNCVLLLVLLLCAVCLFVVVWYSKIAVVVFPFHSYSILGIAYFGPRAGLFLCL
jgi:hypothetical protein